MLSISSLPSAAVPTATLMFGVAPFWCAIAGLLASAGLVLVAVAATDLFRQRSNV